MTTVIETRQAAAAAGRAEIEAAEQEHRQAVDLLAALEERVRAGDAGVQPAELLDARALMEHARLRVDAARRRAEQLATDARHQLYRDIGAEAVAFDNGDERPVMEAFTAAVESLHRLYAVTADRSARVRDLAGRAAAALADAKEHEERSLLREAGLGNAGPGAGLAESASVTITPPEGPARRVADVPAWRATVAALVKVLEEQAAATGDRPWMYHFGVDLGPMATAAVREFPAMAAPTAPGRLTSA